MRLSINGSAILSIGSVEWKIEENLWEFLVWICLSVRYFVKYWGRIIYDPYFYDLSINQDGNSFVACLSVAVFRWWCFTSLFVVALEVSGFFIFVEDKIQVISWNYIATFLRFLAELIDLNAVDATELSEFLKQDRRFNDCVYYRAKACLEFYFGSRNKWSWKSSIFYDLYVRVRFDERQHKFLWNAIDIPWIK